MYGFTELSAISIGSKKPSKHHKIKWNYIDFCGSIDYVIEQLEIGSEGLVNPMVTYTEDAYDNYSKTYGIVGWVEMTEAEKAKHDKEEKARKEKKRKADAAAKKKREEEEKKTLKKLYKKHLKKELDV
jgi:hypothetical protein